MFMQVHFLTSYHASLLNRDDAGLAKRIHFGGVPRLRVSSQCQKRHWREWMTQNTELPSGLRSRHFFSRELKPRLVAGGMDGDTAHALLLHLANKILTTADNRAPLDKDTLQMKQPVLFGRPEADYFVQLIQEAARDGDEASAKDFLNKRFEATKKNFREMRRQAGMERLAAGFEGALFGRFVTSDVLSRVDAPVHVAHAFTTHALDTEVDFFTVVDDLARDEETGAAHANDMELGGGIFYGYVAVDIPLLLSNLTGCELGSWQEQDPGDARDLLELLVQATARVTPGAKLGATAPYARAECLILETGKAQPRSLANAFLKPINLSSNASHPMAQSVRAMAEYVDALQQMYGNTGEKRYVSSVHKWPRGEDRTTSLPEAIGHSLDQIFREGS